MEAISNAFDRATNYLLTIGVADFIDILIVAYLIYKAIWFVRRTNSYNLAKGLIVIIVVLGLSDIFRLTMINFLLRKTMELGLIALLILFQPELRKLLERMGRSFSSARRVASPVMETAIAQTVQACTDMSASRTGALIIFERDVKLNSIMSTGTIVNADITSELIKNLFYNKAPLHDGAVIMRSAKIAAAGCVLPLTQSTNLSKELGMRHRAGIGLSEQSDAVVVIVSEETGSISVALDGMLKRHLTAAALESILRTELVTEEAEESKKNIILNNLKNFFKVNDNEQDKPDEKNL
ncbi:MAG: diadenylate cyclase CdaA [Firmicutes bacterium]|nr:diadenylate cyclase CdaA [Bacillota bacterium]